MDQVLVTGASGFVGSAIAGLLRDRGFSVRVLVRPTSPRTNLTAADSVAIGDLNDRASLAPALEGVRYLVHAAADYRLWVRTPEDMIRTNVEGTRNLMAEALRAGVEKIVYTSSVATLRITDGGPPVDETHPLDPAAAIGPYKRSKVMAERVVESMVERDRLPAVIVNPSAPIGPRDVKPTPTGRVIVQAVRGRMPAFVDTGLNLVHVDDVAAGHLAALERGRVGERYILGGDNVQLAAMFAEIAALAGRRAPRVKLPIGPLMPIAFAAETMARFTGREPFATRDELRMARHLMYFDDAKARRELGYKSRPFREGLRDAIEWFRGAGYLQ